MRPPQRQVLASTWATASTSTSMPSPCSGSPGQRGGGVRVGDARRRRRLTCDSCSFIVCVLVMSLSSCVVACRGVPEARAEGTGRSRQPGGGPRHRLSGGLCGPGRGIRNRTPPQFVMALAAGSGKRFRRHCRYRCRLTAVSCPATIVRVDRCDLVRQTCLPCSGGRMLGSGPRLHFAGRDPRALAALRRASRPTALSSASAAQAAGEPPAAGARDARR